MTQQHNPSAAAGRWNRLSLSIMAAGVAALAGAAVLFVLMLTGTVGDNGYSGPGTSTAIEGDISRYLTPVASPSGPPPSEAPIARLAIPEFGVDAPVVIRGVDGRGIMESPSGPEDVAWYDFSAKPGFGSNAVFSGHVDYINYGPAVFYSLKDLEMGDIIEVRLEDGTVYRYAVANRESVPASITGEEIGRIVGATQQEIITLITCGGSFNPAVGQYDQRVIVRAERVYEPAVGGAGGGSSAQH
jgi:LPXTG-site transpeptidase (sortase) family protein